MVMIILFVLSVLASGFAYSMRVEMKLAAKSFNKSKLEWFGRAGIERAKYLLAMQAKARPPENMIEHLNQDWARSSGESTNEFLMDFNFGDVEFAPGEGFKKPIIVDLERKLNVNVANEAILRDALLLIGADAGSISIIVDSIMDWRDPNEDRHVHGTESEYYLSLDPPYRSKNGPMDDVSELLLIRGVSPELYWGSEAPKHMITPLEPGEETDVPAVGLVDLFTTLSTGRININTASSNVLQVIPGISAFAADRIIQMREERPIQSMEQLAMAGVEGPMLGALRQFCDVRSQTFEVRVEAYAGGETRTFVAVIRRTAANTFQTLSFYWE
jgi:general secretion pathway protein K